MKKTSIDCKLTEDYLDTYHKASLYLSFKPNYLKETDPTIQEITDVLVQAQADKIPVDRVINGDLITFLNHIDSAFSPSILYRRFYAYHLNALLLVIVFAWFNFYVVTSKIQLYFFSLLALISFDIILMCLKWLVGKKIHIINVHTAQKIIALKTIIFGFYFAATISIPSMLLGFDFINTDVSLQFVYLLLGLSLIPVLLTSIIIAAKEHKTEKKIGLSTDSIESELSFKEVLIGRLEEKYIKKSTKKTQKNMKPLSDKDVIHYLIVERKWMFILFPLALTLYLVLISSIIYLAVHDGFSWGYVIIIVILMLFFTLLSVVFSSIKERNLFIYYLRNRDNKVFEKGVIPKAVLNPKFKSYEADTLNSGILD